MRAVRCHDLSGPSSLRVDELPEPTPGPGEVVVDVCAAGVNFPDVLIVQGKYQFKPSPPFIPGVGVAAVELGKALGARVIAAASSEAKLAFCRAHGADEGIDYSKENLKERAKALSGGDGVDVVYDPVGGDFTEAALRALAWEGRL